MATEQEARAMKNQSRPMARASLGCRTIFFGCVFVLVIAAGCAHDQIERKLPPVEVEEPLSPEALRERFQPGWERGTTWMVRDHCDAGWQGAKRDSFPAVISE